jgi:HEAT repeat protein
MRHISPKETPEIIADMMDRLESWDSQRKQNAMYTLGLLAAVTKIPELTAVLLEHLKNDDAEGRALAAHALGAAVDSPESVAALIRHTDDDDLKVRHAVCETLKLLGHSSGNWPLDSHIIQDASFALLGRLTADDPLERELAADALGLLGSDAGKPEVVTALIGRLGDDVSRVRAAAALALGHLGPGVTTDKVCTVLLRKLSDEYDNVRGAAAEALGTLGAAAATPTVIDALIRRLEDSDEFVRNTATRALGGLGAAAAVPVVIAALSSAWVMARRACAPPPRVRWARSAPRRRPRRRSQHCPALG